MLLRNSGGGGGEIENERGRFSRVVMVDTGRKRCEVSCYNFTGEEGKEGKTRNVLFLLTWKQDGYAV